MNKLLTVREFRDSCNKIWRECALEAKWFVDHTLPEQHSRLYGVPEWHHAEDISMPGMSDQEFYGASRFL